MLPAAWLDAAEIAGGGNTLAAAGRGQAEGRGQAVKTGVKIGPPPGTAGDEDRPDMLDVAHEALIMGTDAEAGTQARKTGARGLA